LFHVVIPARYGSSRLPGKPLLKLGGRPMLQWVHDVAQKTGAASVTVATDDPRIADAARGFGAQVAMTSPTHVSGTDRIAEVAQQAGWGEDAVVVNLQGDEPLMPPALVMQVARLLGANAGADIATLASPLHQLASFLDPNVVKVVASVDGRALYFSRAPIPWNRDGAPGGLGSQRSFTGARRHVGLYAYRVAALRRLSLLRPTLMEQVEKLEQLRALENGMDIRVADAEVLPGPDVNTHDDLARVAALLLARPAGGTT
jgi:3-deoxy-manno-octulosonate cytidylyltransferase (CMP-KDO synthetase)